jgi:hypothetical protein
MDLFRFSVGRALIHLGLFVMPQGRTRTELYEIFQVWGEHVQTVVNTKRNNVRN